MIRGSNWERVGRRQYAALHRARRSIPGWIMAVGFLEDRACRRLVTRGLLKQEMHSHPTLRIYSLTARGRSCWLVVQ